jgi:hypothetical protein
VRAARRDAFSTRRLSEPHFEQPRERRHAPFPVRSSNS